MFDASVPEIDRQVVKCLRQKGIAFLPGSDVICYNSMIFAEDLVRLKALGAASRVIFTSSGGNMFTARKMNDELVRRNVPVTIAGPCLSSCAMLILPGLRSIHIHNTAHIAVHGIVGMPYDRWWGWNKGDRKPSVMLRTAAAVGGDDAYLFYDTADIHMNRHLRHVRIDSGFITDISRLMEQDARAFLSCRVDPSNYWTILTPSHLRAYLGASIERMERFVTSWDDPLNIPYQHIGTAISAQTYIMQQDFDAANCARPAKARDRILASN